MLHARANLLRPVSGRLRPAQLHVALTASDPGDAGRLDPCPYFIRIDTASSRLPGGATWNRCRISWTLSRAGGLGSWPAIYRYVTDPRRGMGGATRDLSTWWKGIAAAWVLSAGTWTVNCLVTAPNGEVGYASASVVVAANARTAKYVNSATGVDDGAHGAAAGTPYATLAYALAQHGASDAIEYIVAGGHVETVAGSPLEATGDLAWIHWDESGARPVFSSSLTIFARVAGAGTAALGTVWEGLTFTPTATYSAGNGFEQRGYASAMVDLLFTGALGGNRFYNVFSFGPAGLGTTLLLNNVTQATVNYSVNFVANNAYGLVMRAGNSWGPSSDESCCRTTAAVSYYCGTCETGTMTGGSGKSFERLTQGDYHFFYACANVDGDMYLGNAASGASEAALRWCRYEAGDLNGKRILFEENVESVTFCYNLVSPTSGNRGLTMDTNLPESVLDLDVHHNTIDMRASVDQKAIQLAAQGTITPTGSFHHNLIVVDPATTAVQAEVDTTSIYFHDNVWTPIADTGASALINVGAANLELADWLAQDFVSNDLEVSTSLAADFTPTPKTETGIWSENYSDYYDFQTGIQVAAGAVA